MNRLLFSILLFITCFMGACASSPGAGHAASAPAPLGTGKNAYFHVVLEKPNGLDLRWGGKLPPSVLQGLEQKGKAVRPDRTPKFVSYWGFMANGDFLTMDVIDAASLDQDFSYAGLDKAFAAAPSDGSHWAWSGGGLKIGPNSISVTRLTAGDPASGGNAGEYVMAALDSAGKPVYYYVGTFVQ